MSGFWLTEEQEAIREGVAKVCAAFDDDTCWLSTAKASCSARLIL